MYHHDIHLLYINIERNNELILALGALNKQNGKSFYYHFLCVSYAFHFGYIPEMHVGHPKCPLKLFHFTHCNPAHNSTHRKRLDENCVCIDNAEFRFEIKRLILSIKDNRPKNTNTDIYVEFLISYPR